MATLTQKTSVKIILLLFTLLIIASFSSLNKTSATTYYNYNFAGPYYYDGSIPSLSNQTASITALWANGSRTNFAVTVTSLGTSVSTYHLTSTNPVYQILWNASTTLSLTSIIDFQPLTTTQNINIYIPASSSPTFNYTFTVTDFVGMTHPYIECGLSTNGATVNLLQQADLSAASTATFVLAQYGTYTLIFLCDQGTYSQQFTAEGTYNTNLQVMEGAFPSTNSTYPVAYVERLNSSMIALSYTDPTSSTEWMTETITHLFGSTTILDYTSNTTGSSQTILWNHADSDTSYSVTVTSSITNDTSSYGSLPSWQFAIGTLSPANPWLGVFDFLGKYVNTMPYTPTGWTGANGQQITSSVIAEFIAMAIILLFLGVGSYRSSGMTCIIAWIASGILMAMGWWANGTLGAVSAIPSFALCGFIAIVIHLQESKEQVREF